MSGTIMKTSLRTNFRRHSFYALVWALSLVFTALVGCDSGVEVDSRLYSCSDDSDCGADRVCSDGVCRADDGLDAGADANDAPDSGNPDDSGDADDSGNPDAQTTDGGEPDADAANAGPRVVLIQDITRRSAPERCIDGASPGADLLGVELLSSTDTPLSTAQHVASSINAGRFNGYMKAQLAIDGQPADCVSSVTQENMVSLGCEGRLAVIFEKPLEHGQQIEVAEYGGSCEGECTDSSNCRDDVYEVRVCTDEVDAISGGDFSSCKMVLGQSSEGHTFTVRLDEEADFDGDGVRDVEDNCPSVANQSQTASDRDYLGDACDNCPEIDNTDQANQLGNRTGDACEVTCPGRNPPSCPSATTCRFVDTDKRACFLADDRDEGAECNGDIDTCREGLQCLTQNSYSSCFRLCESHGDCGDEDDVCVSTEFSNGTFDVCQPSCFTDTDCFGGTCCVDGVCDIC